MGKESLYVPFLIHFKIICLAAAGFYPVIISVVRGAVFRHVPNLLLSVFFNDVGNFLKFPYSFSNLRREMLMVPSCIWFIQLRLFPQP